MDQIMSLLGNEGGPHITLRRLQEKRKEIEAVPQPVKVSKFAEWKTKKEEELKVEIESMAKEVVLGAVRESADNEQLLLEYALKKMEQGQQRLSWPVIFLEYLDLITSELEDAVYKTQKGHWDERFLEIDRSIRNAEVNLPKPFTEEDINIAKFNGQTRFPSSRCGQDKDGWFDRWLTEGLGEKKSIHFSDENYVEKLIQYYHQVYWTTAEREKAERELPKAPPSPRPVQQPKPKVEQSVELLRTEFYEKEGSSISPLSLNDRINKMKRERMGGN